jgi:hypothetical protein
MACCSDSLHGGEGKIKLVGGKEMERGRTTGILIHLARVL